MVRRLLVALAAVAAATGTARAQAPAGAAFRVNTYTTEKQWFSDVAVQKNGDFVVVWESFGGQDGRGTGVFGQHFDRRGNAIGAEFLVNSHTTGYQLFYGWPSIAGDGNGNFVVAWASYYQDGPKWDVYAQRFSATGPVGTEFSVNSTTAGSQGGLEVYNGLAAAMDAHGNFVVVWMDDNGADGDGDGTGVRGQRFDASGNRSGGEFQVNTSTTGYQGMPEVGIDAAGRFLVVWSTPDGSGQGVAARRFAADGTAIGAEFRVNTYTTGDQSEYVFFGPAAAVHADGSFVVSWSSPSDGSVNGVFARRFDADAVPLGSEFRVNTYTTGYQMFSRIGLDADGGFLVAWQSLPQDGSIFGLYGQRYNRSGAPRGGEFQINAETLGFQGVPVVAMDAPGNFVITSQESDATGYLDIIGRRFGGLGPTAVSVDADGNGVLEPGETVAVRPSWENFQGGPLSWGGTLTEISGPAGAVYSITDGLADYGTVADGGTAACVDCYRVSVSDPAARPEVHWDASALETITPEAQGQRKRWALHVGRSFSDVAVAGPAYRFIETLLHHRVTGGCSATGYCPGTVTTREQMAVFVLLGREGAGFSPPACAPPNVFDDVPETSAFCRWVEELSRRGVVGGCSGGHYCPTDPVTREQMAVFVLRTLDPALDPPACTSPVFDDVPPSSPFCRWIEELARRGVVAGCGGGSYCPTAPVTREQMSVFISATFGLALYGL